MNPILWPLTGIYRAAAGLRSVAYRRGVFKTRKLSRPVVSIGNLTVGGTGKTPLVEYVAGLPIKHGWKPGILTRGYRRRNKSALIGINAGDNRLLDPREIGDEPALLARKLPGVSMVVGANRFLAGRMAEDRFGVDIHILDDGFQHLALHRDLDIVVLDVTRNLEKESLLPAGRLREPVTALGRAHLVVLSRVELADPKATEEFARRINPQAKIFHARTVLSELVDVVKGRVYPASAFQDEPVYAFCGVGNPGVFFCRPQPVGIQIGGHGFVSRPPRVQ